VLSFAFCDCLQTFLSIVLIVHLNYECRAELQQLKVWSPSHNNLIPPIVVAFASDLSLSWDDLIPIVPLGYWREEGRIHPGVAGGFTKSIQIRKSVEYILILISEIY
jgi:hypothetical protein